MTTYKDKVRAAYRKTRGENPHYPAATCIAIARHRAKYERGAKARRIPAVGDSATHEYACGISAKISIEVDEDCGFPWDDDYYIASARWIRIKDDLRHGERYIAGPQRCCLAWIPSKECPRGAYEAVEKHIGKWLAEDWLYVGVCVSLLDSSGNELYSDSLWGIESSDDCFIVETARDMLARLIRDYRREVGVEA